jgi:hypothetical protein
VQISPQHAIGSIAAAGAAVAVARATGADLASLVLLQTSFIWLDLTKGYGYRWEQYSDQ